MVPRVLVVDDEPSIRWLISQVLEEEGLLVETAANGLEALEKIARQLPDLVLLDLSMPFMNGAEVVQRLRAAEATRQLPVVVVSGSTNLAEFPDMALVQGYLVKPFDLQELVRVARQVLAGERTWQRGACGAG